MRSMFAVVLTLTLFAASTASAECAMPRPFFLPAPGSSLPANPTLYFFGPEYTLQDKLELKAFDVESNTALQVEQTKLPTVDGFRAWKVKVTAPAKTRLRFKGVPGVDSVGDWATGESVKAGALVLTRGADVQNAWTCSYNGLRVLDSSIDAPAYRIEFAASENELQTGKPSSVVIDGHNGAFGNSETTLKKVQLGHRSCVGFNFKWKKPKLAVRVTALLADGTERKSEQIFMLDAPKQGFSE